MHIIKDKISSTKKLSRLLSGLDSLLEAGYYKGNDRFPQSLFKALYQMGAFLLNVPPEYGGLGLGPGNGNGTLLGVLKKIGSLDLSAGRIYEGHVNAMLLIDEYGSEKQKKRYYMEARSGILFGVWNSELPFEGVKINEALKHPTLSGAKVFCSGASHVQRPIITIEGNAGKQMLVLHMEELLVKEDYTYWKPIGMKASESCRFDFSGVSVEPSHILGDPGDYEREPDFSGGAVRFSAVQLGGAEAAIRATLEHLLKLGRTENQNQIRRMGRLAILRERGESWMHRVGKIVDKKETSCKKYVHVANMFRTEARDICEEVLRLAELSVGLQGLIAPHPLERIHRDLSVYLKQPGPDRALEACGRYYIQNNRLKC